MQARLQDREHLLGVFSLADVAVASWLQVGGMFGIDVDSHPRVADWLRRCSERGLPARPIIERATREWVD